MALNFHFLHLCALHRQWRSERLTVLFCNSHPMITVSSSLLQDECACCADRLQCKAMTVSRHYRKEFCEVPLVHFSVSHKKRYDLANVAIDNALIGLVDETRTHPQ